MTEQPSYAAPLATRPVEATVRLPGSKDLADAGGLSRGRIALLLSGVLLLVVLTVVVLRRSPDPDGAEDRKTG